MSSDRPRLLWLPLAPFERDGLRKALERAGLAFEDTDAPGHYFWRFEQDDVPVGFGGVEVHGEVGLLRSIVTLPPLRHQGLGGGMVAALEGEARALGCSRLYVIAGHEVAFFCERGFSLAEAAALPAVVRERVSAAGNGEPAQVMTKWLG